MSNQQSIRISPVTVFRVLRPRALYVPGHVLAVPSPGAEFSGLFAGEDRVEAVKEGWYTVKAVPADVTPERPMEIFLAAIKEKSYALYTDSIDPQRRRGYIALDQLRYHSSPRSAARRWRASRRA